ncbi:putative glucose-6-phosphate 1-epimerase [Anoplophora glabripennis]|uniref:putative glucose-6-phosphate 1-epimerase n=1 Tax=Anoplophora glabripennis TaxID=217634 RepID=UPI00087395C1|nr:putative glucose-6-phosphate 1-epimerase [Anoplophora glabripennis]
MQQNFDNISTIHPQKIVVLDRGDYTSCTLNLHGATVTSWRIKNQEMVFVSRQSHFTGLSHIRGGIQFVFPVMGSWIFGPNHGFARDLPWDLEEGPNKTDTGDVYAIIRLTANPYTNALWAYKFKLYYKITLYEYKIVFNIGVENISEIYPFEFNIMQHSLMRVPDVTKCEFIGFKNCRYKDCLKNNEMMKEEREKVTISEHTDRIYINAPNQVVVTNVMKGGSLKIVKKRTRDINLWNPWTEKSLTIPDLGNNR